MVLTIYANRGNLMIEICVSENLIQEMEVKLLTTKKYGYLKIRLKEEGITYSQIARELTQEPATISNKMNGKADFRIGELDKIIDMLGETDPREICRLLNIDKKKFA